MKVVIRTHGGGRIGLGHVRRCLTLAEALARQGAEVTFAVNQEDDVPGLIERHGFEAARVCEAPGQPGPTLAALAERGASTLIVDSYEITADYLTAARGSVKTLVALDDLADRPLPVDVVLNAAIGAEALPYPALTNARLLLGPAYALLRGEFALEPDRMIGADVGRVLVTVGGGDAQDLTSRLARWAREMLPDATLDVVIGPFFERELDFCDARVTLHHDPEDMRELMLACDLALCSGGQTTYELAATGTPAVAVQVADNQEHNLAGLVRAGTLLPAGRADALDLEVRVRHNLRELAGHVEQRAAMSERGRALVDGRGAQRAAQAILECARQASAGETR